jgi:DNA modification methylase
MARNDLSLEQQGWRKYLGRLNPGTLWYFNQRGKGGSAGYPGNFAPQIASQLVPRYTSKGDLVLDLFAGSETTFDVCERLERRYGGCDLRPHSRRTSPGDARSWRSPVPAQMVFLHPPYADMIDYNQALWADPRDLSLPYRAFLVEFARVAANTWHNLVPGGVAVLVIGDMFMGGEYIPLAFHAMTVMMEAGFTLVADHIKNFGSEVMNQNKNYNLWFYRCLKNGHPLLEHEHVFVFERRGTGKAPGPLEGQIPLFESVIPTKETP